jgi:uncharacterized damage-inducible protein DinB
MAKRGTTGSREGRGPARGTDKSAGVSGAERRRDRSQPVDLSRALVEAFLTNERINQVLLELLDPKVWRAQPPCSKRKNIATTFAHIHNVRCMRIKMSAPDEELPEKLDRAEVTQAEAKEFLGRSACAMVRLIERSIASGGHVSLFRPDVVGLVCAAITHDAHHRGQICHWASQLGAPLTPEQQLQVWEWDKRWKEVAGK